MQQLTDKQTNLLSHFTRLSTAVNLGPNFIRNFETQFERALGVRNNYPAQITPLNQFIHLWMKNQ